MSGAGGGEEGPRGSICPRTGQIGPHWVELAEGMTVLFLVGP